MRNKPLSFDDIRKENEGTMQNIRDTAADMQSNIKRNPVTPLPWNDVKLWERSDYDYALHAANTYPRLLAALIEARKHLGFFDNDYALPIDDLLLELGEA